MLPIVIGVAFPGKCGDGCTGREILEFGYRGEGCTYQAGCSCTVAALVTIT